MAKGAPGGMNMMSIMKQAQKMQKQMTQMQEELEAKTIETTAGGGAIKVVMTGKKQLKEIKIDPSVIDAEDPEMLEDLVMSAMNEALRQAEEMYQGEMNKISGGLGGMPF